MHYQMQEGYLILEKGAWQDRSVNMLAPAHLPEGTNLVVSREALPEGVRLADYIAHQKSVLATELPSLQLVADTADSIEGLAAHFLELTWDNQGIGMHQLLYVIEYRQSALTLTATLIGKVEEAARVELLAAMKSFTPGPAPAVSAGDPP